MASIERHLASVSVPEALWAAADGHWTGDLVVRAEGERPQEARIYLRDGDVCHAAMSGSQIRLGTRLNSAGLVSATELEQAVSLLDGPNGHRRLGEILVELGLVPRLQMERIVQKQIEDIVFEAVCWREGSMALGAGAAAEDGAGVHLSVANLLSEAAVRFGEWAEISRRIPSADCVPVFRDGGGGNDEVELTSEQWSFLARTDGIRTLTSIADLCGFTLFEAARTLYRLVEASVLAVDAPAGAFFNRPSIPQVAVADVERILEAMGAGARPPISLQVLLGHEAAPSDVLSPAQAPEDVEPEPGVALDAREPGAGLAEIEQPTAEPGLEEAWSEPDIADLGAEEAPVGAEAEAPPAEAAEGGEPEPAGLPESELEALWSEAAEPPPAGEDRSASGLEALWSEAPGEPPPAGEEPPAAPDMGALWSEAADDDLAEVEETLADLTWDEEADTFEIQGPSVEMSQPGDTGPGAGPPDSEVRALPSPETEHDEAAGEPEPGPVERADWYPPGIDEELVEALESIEGDAEAELPRLPPEPPTFVLEPESLDIPEDVREEAEPVQPPPPAAGEEAAAAPEGGAEAVEQMEVTPVGFIPEPSEAPLAPALAETPADDTARAEVSPEEGVAPEGVVTGLLSPGEATTGRDEPPWPEGTEAARTAHEEPGAPAPGLTISPPGTWREPEPGPGLQEEEASPWELPDDLVAGPQANLEIEDARIVAQEIEAGVREHEEGEELEYRSIVRQFADFADMATIVSEPPEETRRRRAPPPPPEKPRRKELDPEVDTTSLMREFVALGGEGKEEPPPSPPPPRKETKETKPGQQERKPEQKGRGLFGRKRR